MSETNLPTVSFSADKTVIIEGGEAQLLTFNLSEPAPGGGLVVDLRIDDPDGESGPGDTEFPPELISNIVDFGQVEEDGVITASLTIAEGATEATFGIAAFEDEQIETGETYSLTLLEGENYIADPNFTTITTTIEDNMTENPNLEPLNADNDQTNFAEFSGTGFDIELIAEQNPGPDAPQDILDRFGNLQDTNQFILQDSTDPDNTALIFDGPDGAGTEINVEITEEGVVLANGEQVATGFDDNFYFGLVNNLGDPDGIADNYTFSTNNGLNQALVAEGEPQFVTYLQEDGSYIIGAEELPFSISNQDFDDLIVEVSGDISPVGEEPQATVTFDSEKLQTVFDSFEDIAPNVITVSLTPETLIATEGETFAWNFSLDAPAPSGGLSLFLPITVNNDPAPGDVEYFVEGSSNISEFEFITTDNESISQIYAFGDSYSDDGLSLEISTAAVEADIPDSFILPADPELGLYDEEGRWTNGPTAVEVLSENLDVDLTSYAVGGAKSGDGNYYSWLDSFQNTGVFGQIEQFNTELAGQPADPDALYFIFASANDFFEYADFGLPGTIEELAVQTVENIKDGISDLAASGAEKFLVVNSSDLGILPGTIEFEQAEDAALFTKEINSLLPQELPVLEQELDIDLVLYDHVGISDEIRLLPEEFGLTNIDDPYQPVFPVEIPSGNSNEYYFWDEYHPTSRTHEIIGEDMVDFVDFDNEGEVSTGFNITIAEGEIEATLVSEVLIDGVEEGEESFTTVLTEGEDYNVNHESDQVVTNLIDADISGDLSSPVFGTTEADIIEVDGSDLLIFAGDSEDLIDASKSEGGNRIYGGNDNDTVVLGEGDRVFGEEGDDQFFATSGGNNTITGGAGADQFWIAVASIPESANTITDFTSGEDVIGIAGLGVGFEDLTISQTDGNTIIAASGSDLAVLTDIDADSLSSDNFAFG